MSATVIGTLTVQGERDDEGHRTFTVVSAVKTTDVDDGPLTVMNASGAYAVGSTYSLGNDSDSWAFCYPYAKVTIKDEKEGDPTKLWKLEQKFSTKPLKRCQDTSIENPLSEPQKISGSFVQYTKEAAFDRHGRLIKSSSHELFRGPQTEFDAHRATVKIQQNVSSLGLATFTAMVNTVNDSTLWGLSARKIKLSNVAWERQLYGSCTYYYTRGFEFDIDFEGFDRRILDEGTKVLNGHWQDPTGTGSGSAGTAGSEWVLDDINGAAPNKNNPQHFIRYKDRNGENARIILDGNGEPLADGENPYYFDVEYYAESNFLLLGIPTSL